MSDFRKVFLWDRMHDLCDLYFRLNNLRQLKRITVTNKYAFAIPHLLHIIQMALGISKCGKAPCSVPYRHRTYIFYFVIRREWSLLKNERGGIINSMHWQLKLLGCSLRPNTFDWWWTELTVITLHTTAVWNESRGKRGHHVTVIAPHL